MTSHCSRINRILKVCKALPPSDPCIVSHHFPTCSLPPVPLVFLPFLFLRLHVLTSLSLTPFTSLAPFHPLYLPKTSFHFLRKTFPDPNSLFKFLCCMSQRQRSFTPWTPTSVYRAHSLKWLFDNVYLHFYAHNYMPDTHNSAWNTVDIHYIFDEGLNINLSVSALVLSCFTKSGVCCRWWSYLSVAKGAPEAAMASEMWVRVNSAI